MPRAREKKEKQASDELRVVPIDIGGTGLKASVVEASGRRAVPRRRLETPCSCPPSVMLEALAELVAPRPPHNHFGNKDWAGFPLAAAASERFGDRMINDAEMQALAVIRGKGLALMLTLGTGTGTALFREGTLLEKVGRKPLNKRVERTIEILASLLHFDHRFIGGGNARKLWIESLTIVPNDAGLEGGAAFWRLPEPAPAQ